jgi:Retroviral aspartyl protease
LRPQLKRASASIENKLDGRQWPSSGLATIASAKAAIDNASAKQIQRNSAATKDFTRVVPNLIVVFIKINGQAPCALIDSGSLADFISTTLADQLKLKKQSLAKGLTVKVAVSGWRSKVNFGSDVEFHYQERRTKRHFDIMNVDRYDVIPGTPFLHQHKVSRGFNPPHVKSGSNEPSLLKGFQGRTVPSMAADILMLDVDESRAELVACASKPARTR